MKFFNKLDSNVIKFLKIGGLVLGLVIIVPLLLSIVSLMLERLSYDTTSQDLSYGTEESISQTSSKYYGGSESTGDTAEEFEITEYSVSFKVSNLDSMRDNISALKSRDDVIFESANEYKKSGYYVFKIKNDSVDEVLAIIEELDPTTISKSIYTIKSLVDSYVNEIEILESKLSALVYCSFTAGVPRLKPCVLASTIFSLNNIGCDIVPSEPPLNEPPPEPLFEPL